MDRQLATIREVDELIPIEGKDRIEVAVIGGWKVIVKKGDFQVGQFGVYFEIDSLLPLDNSAFAFLKKKEAQTIHRLKTMRMGGVLSQGLLLPLLTPGLEAVHEAFLTDSWPSVDEVGYGLADTKTEGAPIQEYYGAIAKLLGITKYEPPQPGEPGIPGLRIITFPSWISRTDLERCQNLKRDIEKAIASNELFEVTEKLDGSSMTAYARPQPDGESWQIGVCSRNQEIKYDADAPGQYWQAAIEAHWPRAMSLIGEVLEEEVAFQGELVGPGIQSNPYKMDKKRVFLFDIYSPARKRYFLPHERAVLVGLVNLKLGIDLLRVPVAALHSQLLPVSDLIESVDRAGRNRDAAFEGLVFKSETTDMRFKVISNHYLEKHDG